VSVTATASSCSGSTHLEVLEPYFASTRLAAICVPVTFRLVADEIAYVLEDSGASAVVVQATLAGAMAQTREKAGHTGPCQVFTDEVAGADGYEQALHRTAARFGELAVEEQVLALKTYTSGQA
jgi:fatty-acyl-CoA synthase/long-chain acyl-CoA synthetase